MEAKFIIYCLVALLACYIAYKIFIGIVKVVFPILMFMVLGLMFGQVATEKISSSNADAETHVPKTKPPNQSKTVAASPPAQFADLKEKVMGDTLKFVNVSPKEMNFKKKTIQKKYRQITIPERKNRNEVVEYNPFYPIE